MAEVSHRLGRADDLTLWRQMVAAVVRAGGRIADTGVDPIPFMTESVKKAAAKPNCEVLWASTRELINIYQAQACGCQIITVPNSILAKRKNIGRDPYEVSLDTVRGFAKDIAALGFHILP